jgi:hypothetical protein
MAAGHPAPGAVRKAAEFLRKLGFSFSPDGLSSYVQFFGNTQLLL